MSQTIDHPRADDRESMLGLMAPFTEPPRVLCLLGFAWVALSAQQRS